MSGDTTKLLYQLNEIGIALSAEKNHDCLLEMILVKSMDFTKADGGTLYLKNNRGQLEFTIIHTRSLALHEGGESGSKIKFPPISLYDKDGKPNHKMVVAYAVLTSQTINIADAYNSDEFDFSGTRHFDKKTGYHSRSFLTVPLRNHEDDVIGVLQLINATDKEKNIIAFSPLDQRVVESLASQAAIALTNQSLIRAQKKLFDALTQLIANAIDEKSPHTAGHCQRVPEITKMLANAACRVKSGPLKDFSMTEEEKYELEVAAWLHDCGKITTPEYVIDKSTKLETIFDHIKLIDLRMELLKRDLLIRALMKDSDYDLTRQSSIEETITPLVASNPELKQALSTLDGDREFLRQVNIGSESISEEEVARINKIARYSYQFLGDKPVSVISEEACNNLKIGRGTLNMREREIINNHVSVTIRMLESLPYPKGLRRVPEYAGGHHEKMDGSGYPNRLTRNDMSIPARMLAIADVFEALTASDRPYRKAMPLSKTLIILGKMKIDNHIDEDLFNVFISEGVFMEYAKQFLPQEQIDEIPLDDIPGYSG